MAKLGRNRGIEPRVDLVDHPGRERTIMGRNAMRVELRLPYGRETRLAPTASSRYGIHTGIGRGAGWDLMDRTRSRRRTGSEYQDRRRAEIRRGRRAEKHQDTAYCHGS